MKLSLSSLGGLAVIALGAAVSGCGGGGSTAVPTTTTPVSQNPSGGSVPFSSLNMMQAASSTAVTVSSRTPALPAADISDRAPIAVTSTMGSVSQISDQSQHGFAGALKRSTSSSRRSASSVAINSPFDVSYHGGVIIGSTVQHNVFINYDNPTRAALNFQPARFEYDINNDGFITLLYQYLTNPGNVDSTPVTGNYPKGVSVNLTDTYASPRPSSSNPYYGQLSILLAVHNAAVALGSNGGSSYGHVYHVFLPKNVDTCFEAPLGTPTTSCYSPDNSSTFAFCAYHGSFTYSGTLYLYSVEPYQDVSGCRNNIHNQALPNAADANNNPADPGYSTLSHELFETISDPRGNAWWNQFSGGDEIGDECAEFDNFVTVNGNPYVLQSEYSDVNHLCVSANLTSQSQTPQTSSSRLRSVH